MEKPKKVLLITGASSGIGAETARVAKKEGHRLILVARSEDKLKALKDELGSDDVCVIPCDVSDWNSQKEMVERAVHYFGRIDHVFINAGVMTGSTFLGGEDTPNEWRQMVLTNVFGAAVTTRLVLPELIKTKGQLLLTGSVLGRVALAGSFYSSTKWAITGMAESIRQQVIGTGVRVTLIVPGIVDTPVWTTQPNAPTLQAEDISRAVLYAMSQPHNVDVNEIVVRPVGQVR